MRTPFLFLSLFFLAKGAHAFFAAPAVPCTLEYELRLPFLNHTIATHVDVIEKAPLDLSNYSAFSFIDPALKSPSMWLMHSKTLLLPHAQLFSAHSVITRTSLVHPTHGSLGFIQQTLGGSTSTTYWSVRTSPTQSAYVKVRGAPKKGDTKQIMEQLLLQKAPYDAPEKMRAPAEHLTLESASLRTTPTDHFYVDSLSLPYALKPKNPLYLTHEKYGTSFSFKNKTPTHFVFEHPKNTLEVFVNEQQIPQKIILEQKAHAHLIKASCAP